MLPEDPLGNRTENQVCMSPIKAEFNDADKKHWLSSGLEQQQEI